MSDLAAEFRWPVRVYYEDTDAGGIVYHASYLRFLERARTEWLRTLGWEHAALRAREGLQLVVASLHIHFKSPARLDDELRVSVRLSRLRRVSLLLGQSVYGEADAVVADASVAVACVDTASQRPRPFPPSMLRTLE